MNDRGIVSDQVLMDFMKEMREEVKGIKSLFVEQAGHMATVKEKQKNLENSVPKTSLLWGFIGSLVGIIVSLLAYILKIN